MFLSDKKPSYMEKKPENVKIDLQIKEELITRAASSGIGQLLLLGLTVLFIGSSFWTTPNLVLSGLGILFTSLARFFWGKKKISNPAIWLKVHTALIVLNGIAWATLNYNHARTFPDNTAHFIFTYFLIAGITSAASYSLGPSRIMFSLFVCIVSLGGFFPLFWTSFDNELNQSIFSILVVYILFSLKSGFLNYSDWRFKIDQQDRIISSEAKLIIEAAKIQEEKLNEVMKILSATPSCLKIITDKGLLVNMNSQGLSLIEADNLESVLNANVYEVVEETHREAFINFNEKICSGEKGSLIFEIVGLKGTRHWMETFSAPYNLPNGEVGHISITNEITNRVNSQKELDLQRNKLLVKSKLESLGEMSAGIAHEINNPLAIVSGSVEVLSKFKDHPEKFAAKIEVIQKSCDRIARIVSGLKKFSRSSDEKRNFETHSISDIIKEATALIETKSKRHSTSVTIECSTQAQILCDDVEIEQVLVNLINNGIDAVKDKPEKWIKISVFEDGLTVVMRVMDSGLGIPESVRAKLFEPFFTTKKVGEGTGLGLSITKGILDEHKATITVVADCPHTCFEIRFPRAEAMKNAG